MQSNNAKELMKGLFEGMDGFVTSKTVVGEPIKVGDATLIPLMEVSCGMASGAFVQDRNKKGGNSGVGAMSSKITPTAMLVLQDGRTKLINIKNQDSVTKVLDMIPDILDRFTGGSRVSRGAEETAEEILSESEPVIINEDENPGDEKLDG